MFLALDIGNVLCDVNFNAFIKELETSYGLDEAEVWEILAKAQPHQDLGTFSLATYLKDNHSIDTILQKNIMKAWDESVTPNLISMKILSSILDKGVQVALLSNMGVEHRKNIATTLGPDFERCVTHISCDVGARKPQLLYFQSFLLAYPKFAGCVYVDDRMENLDTGARMKFQTHHLDTSKMSIDELKMSWAKVYTKVVDMTHRK